MSGGVTCPSCGQHVDQDAWKCHHCGIDLALAAILAEDRAFAYSNDVTKKVLISPEILVPRLGEILLEKKIIQPGDLQSALSDSAQLASQHSPRLLGQILLDRPLDRSRDTRPGGYRTNLQTAGSFTAVKPTARSARA